MTYRPDRWPPVFFDNYRSHWALQSCMSKRRTVAAVQAASTATATVIGARWLFEVDKSHIYAAWSSSNFRLIAMRFRWKGRGGIDWSGNDDTANETNFTDVVCVQLQPHHRTPTCLSTASNISSTYEPQRKASNSCLFVNVTVDDVYSSGTNCPELTSARCLHYRGIQLLLFNHYHWCRLVPSPIDVQVSLFTGITPSQWHHSRFRDIQFLSQFLSHNLYLYSENNANFKHYASRILPVNMTPFSKEAKRYSKSQSVWTLKKWLYEVLFYDANMLYDGTTFSLSTLHRSWDLSITMHTVTADRQTAGYMPSRFHIVEVV